MGQKNQVILKRVLETSKWEHSVVLIIPNCGLAREGWGKGEVEGKEEEAGPQCGVSHHHGHHLS